MTQGDSGPIDFASLAGALLDRAPTLVPQWLPEGRREGNEWRALNPTRSDQHLGSFSVNLVTGQWADFADDDARGADLISLYAYLHGLNNGQAARRLMQDLGWEKPRTAGPAPGPRPSGNAAPDDMPVPPLDDDAADAARPAPKNKERRASMWRAIVPVPPSAPQATFEHWTRKAEDIELTAEYRFEGALYGYVVRFRTSAGGKDPLPRTWCVDESDSRGTRRWHWKHWDEPRPLFVPATVLSGDLSRPVLLVEGEKCALAGHELLQAEFDLVSWPGGGHAWPKASWGWLKGRTVFMWADRDAKRVGLTRAEREQGMDPLAKPIKPQAKQSGMQAMLGIGSLLLAEHGCTVFLCPIPKPEDESVKDGWDIADAIAEGWSVARLRDFIRSAHVFVPPDDAVRAKAGHASPPSMAGAVPEGDAGSLAWLGHLIQSASGAVRPVRENVALALDGWADKGVKGIAECEQLIRFNEFTNNYEKTRATPWGTAAGAWLEADELLMGDWLVREHRLPSMQRQTLEEGVIVAGRRHAYHPLRDEVEGLRGKWDKQRRLDTWLRRVLMVDDEFDDADPLQRYLTLVGRWFVMGMCARVMRERVVHDKVVVGPGVKFDYMLVLESPTGWGKSTLAKILGGKYFADTGLDVTQKDSLMNIQGIWVYEWSELDQLAKQEIGAVKRFISSASDRFRATFDRRPAEYPRQVVFLGTTEEANYLLDGKGNRRFWPVKVTRPPDLEWLHENRQQMLAEAVQRVDALEPFWPNREQQTKLFNPQQAARTLESSLESELRYRLYDENQRCGALDRNFALAGEVGMSELLGACGFTIDKQTDAVVKKAGSVMHMMGWTVRRTSSPGRPRVYVRPDRPLPPARVPNGSDSSAPPPGHDNPEVRDDDCPF